MVLFFFFKRCKNALREFGLLHDVLGSVHCLGFHLHQQRVAAVRLVFPLPVKPIPKKHTSTLRDHNTLARAHEYTTLTKMPAVPFRPGEGKLSS